ncbi:hypothetical protein [Croceimicrobium sp.]|uniref:hypothetical protein n=1 Tax=Croceimicrobium sp. TaxID=2828340 RepID=UPI003BABB457
MSKYYTVCSERVQADTLEAKSTFQKVGVVKVTDNGGWFLQLYQQPETTFRIFPNTEEELPVIN